MDLALKFKALSETSPEQLAARVNQVVPPWLAAALALVLAWQLARLVWLLFPSAPPVIISPPAPVIEAGNRTPTSSDSVALIASRHLFGVFEREPGPKIEDNTPPPETIQETALSNLTLKGTVAASEEVLSFAIIEDNGEEKVFAIGDEVSRGRELYAVERERVVFKRGAEFESLTLPERSQGTSTSASSRSSRLSRTSSQRGRDSRSVRQLIADNPAKLTDLIRPQPVFSNGKQQGYRVYPGRKRQEFSQLGLKPGDLVTEINGTPLDDPAKGMEIFRSLADSNQVSVTVKRNGMPQVIVLDTTQLQSSEEDGR